MTVPDFLLISSIVFPVGGGGGDLISICTYWRPMSTRHSSRNMGSTTQSLIDESNSSDELILVLKANVRTCECILPPKTVNKRITVVYSLLSVAKLLHVRTFFVVLLYLILRYFNGNYSQFPSPCSWNSIFKLFNPKSRRNRLPCGKGGRCYCAHTW